MDARHKGEHDGGSCHLKAEVGAAGFPECFAGFRRRDRGAWLAAGQVGWDRDRRLAGGDFVAQFDRALANALAVVAAAGGEPTDVVRMTLYVAERRLYAERLAEVGAAWRARMGRHFPAMTLVEVAALLEEGALVEVEATAALPPEAE